MKEDFLPSGIAPWLPLNCSTAGPRLVRIYSFLVSGLKKGNNTENTVKSQVSVSSKWTRDYILYPEILPSQWYTFPLLMDNSIVEINAHSQPGSPENIWFSCNTCKRTKQPRTDISLYVLLQISASHSSGRLHVSVNGTYGLVWSSLNRKTSFYLKDLILILHSLREAFVFTASWHEAHHTFSLLVGLIETHEGKLWCRVYDRAPRF